MIASTNRRSKSTVSYANNGHGATTATDPDRDYPNAYFSDQPVHYLVPTDMFIDEYSDFTYTKLYEPLFVPAHRKKNPFEHEIFKEIVSKHNVCVKNMSKNVTFNRINMKGFS